MGERLGQRQTTLVYARNMLSHDLLDEWLPRLQQRAVRDLAWTLLAAPLLEKTPCTQRHPLTGSGWAQRPALLADWLLEQDKQPQALLTWLSQARSQRLGMHYERLWQFALQQAPGISLLDANMPIREGGRTFGELDLLLRDADGEHHLELAIKLYLGPAGGDGRLLANWRGAGRTDNLQRKLQHLALQQLPLSATPQAQQILAAHDVQHVQAELWMSGYLFYPWPAGCAAPTGCSPEHSHGRWLHRGDWADFRKCSTAQHWQPIPRDCRLAPLRIEPDDFYSPLQLHAWLESLGADAAPSLLAGFAQKHDGSWYEAERVMLLNDQWPASLKN